VTRPPILAGLTFVVLGSVLLLDELGHLDATGLLSTWWPLLVVAAGVVQLALPPRSVGSGLLLVVGGSVLLLWRLDVVDDLGLLWPALLLTAGLWLLLGRGARGGTRAEPATWTPDGAVWSVGTRPDRVEVVGDRVHVVTVFADRTLRAEPGALRGGTVVTVFGDVDLDLRDVTVDGTASLDGVTIFGDVDVTVPASLPVRSAGATVFGTVRVEPPTSPSPDPPRAELRLDLVTIFGDVQVRRAPVEPSVPSGTAGRAEDAPV
jgi:hypothetical protein